MSLCKFSENFQIFDITPIENLFIHEFMLKAPGDFVKIYIYGLKQCYHPHSSENTLEAFSHALGIETQIIENAFHYWERQGILAFKKEEDQQLCLEFFNIKDVLYNKGLNSEKTMYQYKDFNQNLQQMFDTRLLTPQEYLRVYDWIEVLNLPMEVVLMMIQFYISKMGRKVKINYLDKVAEGWSRDGINTMQKAEEYIESNDVCFKDTLAVLKYLGIHRTPSKAELELYKKWRDQWGYSLSAILLTCKETTKVQSPTMAYLDKILFSFYNKDITTPQDVKDHLDTKDNVYSKLKEIYYQLGHKDNSPTPEHQSMYKIWTTEYKLEHGVILLACKQCVRNKTNSFEHLDNLLKQWLKNGLVTESDIKDYLSKKKTTENEIKAILERAGDSREVTLSDRKLYKQWTESWNLSFEVILQAAEYSIMAKDKLPFIHKILTNWYDKGITNIRDAKADHERHTQALDLLSENKGMKKQLDFNKFPQHSYTEEELENLFENIEKS